jgi:hypothetical protein
MGVMSTRLAASEAPSVWSPSGATRRRTDVPARSSVATRNGVTSGGVTSGGLTSGGMLRDVVPGPRWQIGSLPVRPASLEAARPAIDLPSGQAGETDRIDQPPAPAPADAGPAPPAAAADSCGQPRSMGKVTAGNFLGGVAMDDYYPYLSGKGFWQHPGSGGTFDTGQRVGAVVQLYGVIPAPCEPSQYTLAQSVTYTRARFDGVTDPNEGKPQDDVANSGQNQSRAPFRQGFVGGGAAPLGYIISMADPPSMAYGASSNAEWDRDFTTSLIGPGGKQSVDWSVSIRIVNGKVTRVALS